MSYFSLCYSHTTDNCEWRQWLNQNYCNCTIDFLILLPLTLWLCAPPPMVAWRSGSGWGQIASQLLQDGRDRRSGTSLLYIWIKVLWDAPWRARAVLKRWCFTMFLMTTCWCQLVMASVWHRRTTCWKNKTLCSSLSLFIAFHKTLYTVSLTFFNVSYNVGH